MATEIVGVSCMFFRIKVVKCADIVVDADNMRELDIVFQSLKRICDEKSKVYVHILERAEGKYIDQGAIFNGLLKEVQPDMLSQYYR